MLRHKRLILHIVCICVAILDAKISLSQTPDELQAISQFVGPTTIAFGSLDLSALPLSRLDAAVGNQAELSQFVSRLHVIRNTLGSGKLYVIADLPFSAAQPPLRFAIRRQSQQQQDAINQLLNQSGWPVARLENGFLIATQNAVPVGFAEIELKRDLFPPVQPKFEAAWKALGSGAVKCVVVPPVYLQNTLVELMPTLPRPLGGGRTSEAIDGLQSVALKIDTNDSTVHAMVQSKDAVSAQRFSDQLPEILSSAFAALEAQPIARQLRRIPPANVKSNRIDSQIHYTFDLKNLGLDANQALQLAAEAMGIPTTELARLKRLKKLDLAILNFESAFHSYPSIHFRAGNEQPNLSWRVHILPYLGHAKLYTEFHLDEPWNSPHNIQLLDKMPEEFRSSTRSILSPEVIQPGHTTYVAPAGEGSILAGTKPVKVGEVLDGISHTALFVEVMPEHAVPWTAPLDYEFDPANPAQWLRVDQDGKFLAAMADGSVDSFRNDQPAAQIKGLFNIADGIIVKMP